VRRPGQRIYNRSFKERNFDRLVQFQHAPGKVATNKSRPHGGFTKSGPSLLDRTRDGSLQPINIDLAQNQITPRSSKADAGLMSSLQGAQNIHLTPAQRSMLNLRQPGAQSETAAARKARMANVFAERQRGLTRGGAATSDVIPAAQIADDSSFSALGFVGISGTEDFFDEAVLLGDVDGNFATENDFDGAVGPRTFVDRQAKVDDDALFSDEVYTATEISGHNQANGFGGQVAPQGGPAVDYNVFYTATNAGFVSVLGDNICDGDLLADTVLSVVSAQDLGFSTSASITGLAVNTDSEYDGDLATDEIVWFTILDPEFGGQSGSQVSAIAFILDSDGDDIPDAAGAGVFATSTSLSVAGIAVDNFGDIYFPVTNFATGVIFKAWDVDEDRLPDVGFAQYNAITNLDLANTVNAVDIAVDRFNTIYLQIARSDLGPLNTGLPSHVATYIDRCGDFDTNTGLIPRPDEFADTPFRVFAADADVAQPAGAGDDEVSPPLVIPGMQIDYAGAYRGLAVDWDDNVYVAYGALPAGEGVNPSPLKGGILRIPDTDCDRVGDFVDANGDGVFGGTIEAGGDANDNNDPSLVDYQWLQSPLNQPTITPNGINSIGIGPLFSLERVGLGLGDDEGIGFAFDDFDGEANMVAGGVNDLLFATACDNVGSNPAGGPVGFEWLFCNTAWTGFRLGSNGNIVFRFNSPIQANTDPLLTDFTPTVTEFLSSDAPQVAPLWADLTPGGGGQFSLHHLGFAATDAFIIRTINVPSFGNGGVGTGTDPFGFPKRGETNNFDVTFYDDSDAFDDVNAEIFGDETNLNQLVNDDNDGTAVKSSFARQGSRKRPPVGDRDPNTQAALSQVIDRNGDGDITDDGLSSFSQEGVGRIKPEQGPFKFVYHQMEIIGDAPIIVGFTTGADDVFNTGTIPPGLCETNLSAASPAFDSPFFNGGCIGMGTEPSLYELFLGGVRGGVDPQTGIITPSTIDFDLRQQVDADCIARPERFVDTAFADCLCFTGSNIPVGLFCTDIDVTAVDGNTDPFLGDANLQITGFCFPMPTSGENAICPDECGTTAELCRAGKSITYDVVFKFDEDGDGIVDATMMFAEPDVVVTNENQINLTINFAQTTLCGGDVQVCIFATYGFGDDNKYFELQQLDGDAALEVAPVQLTCASFIDIGARAPVVLAIAPDIVNCDDPDDPDNVEDVLISGLCFFGNIQSAYVTLSPDDSDPAGRIALQNVINIGPNQVTATVPLAQLTQRDVPYYVFVVRGDGVRSTTYPNVFGFDVTFTCASQTTGDDEISLTSCRVVRNSVGRYILQVNGVNFRPNDTVILLNGQPCRRNRYPSRFISPSDGTTTRINCSGGLRQALPAVVTARNQSNGATSINSLQCDFNR
jgi:hypothetical protein